MVRTLHGIHGIPLELSPCTSKGIAAAFASVENVVGIGTLDASDPPPVLPLARPPLSAWWPQVYHLPARLPAE